MELIEAVTQLMADEYPTIPYNYTTRVNLIGNELVEFMVNVNGAVRFFVAPTPEYDENVIKTFLKTLKREMK